MPDNEKSEPRAKAIRSRATDLDDLLKLAKELKESCDDNESKADHYRTMLYGILGGVMSLAGVTISLMPYLSRTNVNNDKYLYSSMMLVLFTLLGFLMMYTLIIRQRISRYRNEFYSDMIALDEVVQLMRETEALLEQVQGWSTLDKARYRIQLARFAISNRKRYASSFFPGLLMSTRAPEHAYFEAKRLQAADSKARFGSWNETGGRFSGPPATPEIQRGQN